MTVVHEHDVQTPGVLAQARGTWGRDLLGILAFAAFTVLLYQLVSDSRSYSFSLLLWLAYSITALGFRWVFGIAGRFAFCQTFLMTVGGFTSAFIVRELGPGWFLLGLVGAAAAAGLVAAVVGWIARDAREFYFAIATLAVAEIGTEVLIHGSSFTGPNGTAVGIPFPRVLGTDLSSNTQIFALFLVLLCVFLVVSGLIERAPAFRFALATRDNDVVAAMAGARVASLRIAFFVLGAALGGVSGALIGHWNGVMSVDTFGIDLAIGIFLIVLLGGSGSKWGPVLGAAFYILVPLLLHGLDLYADVVYGVVLLLVIMFAPGGLTAILRALFARVGRRLLARRA